MDVSIVSFLGFCHFAYCEILLCKGLVPSISAFYNTQFGNVNKSSFQYNVGQAHFTSTDKTKNYFIISRYLLQNFQIRFWTNIWTWKLCRSLTDLCKVLWVAPLRCEVSMFVLFVHMQIHSHYCLSIQGGGITAWIMSVCVGKLNLAKYFQQTLIRKIQLWHWFDINYIRGHSEHVYLSSNDKQKQDSGTKWIV